MCIIDHLKRLRDRLTSDHHVALAAGLFGLFLGSIFITDNVRAHRNIYYLLVIPLFALQVRASFFSGLIRSRVFQVTLLYLVYLWLSLFWASATNAYNLYNEARTLALMLVFLAVTAFFAVKMDRFPLLLAKCLGLVVGAAALISLAWFYSTHSFASWGGLESRAVDIGLAAHPIDSAATYGLVAVLLMFTLFPGRPEPKLGAWLWPLSLIAVMAFIAMTQTRGVIISLAGVTALGLAAQKKRRLLLILAILTVATLGVIIASMHHPEGMVGFERRFAVRWEIWQVSLGLIREHPWFGFGLNEHQTLYLSHGGYEGVAHSLYLENLLFGGLVGTGILGLLLAAALRQSWREYRRNGDFLYPALVLFPMFSGISTGYLTLSKITPEWIQFWLPMGLIIGAELRSRGLLPNHRRPDVHDVGGKQ